MQISAARTRLAALLAALLAVLLILSAARVGDTASALGQSAFWLALLWMAASLGRARRLWPRWIMALWLSAGAWHLGALWLGAAPGWNVRQNLGSQSSSEPTRYSALDFGPGNAPVHQVNNPRLGSVPPRNQDELWPLQLRARAFVWQPCTLLITGSAAARVTLGSRPLAPRSDLRFDLEPRGEEPIEISIRFPQAASAALRVQLDGDVALASATFSSPWRRWLGQSDALLGRAAPLVLLLLLIRQMWRARRQVPMRGAAISLLMVMLVLGAALFKPPVAHSFGELSRPVDAFLRLDSGDDWRTYEGFARDIGQHGPLMLLGRRPGSAAPFYYQPFYPYALAVAHAIVGPSPRMVLWLQLLGACGLLVMISARVEAGREADLALCVVALSGIGAVWLILSQRLLSENLLLLFYAAFLLSMPRKHRGGLSNRRLLLLGAWLGLAVVTRTTTLLALPFLARLLWIEARGSTRSARIRAMTAFVLPVLLLWSLVPLRNLAASGRAVLMPTSGLVNIVQGNVPPNHRIADAAWSARLAQLEPGSDAWHFVVLREAIASDAAGVARRMVQKALYVVGVPRPLLGTGAPIFWPVLSLWLLCAATWKQQRRARNLWMQAAWILTWTHCAALVLVFPNVYFYRLVLPAMLPLAALDAAALALWIGERRARARRDGARSATE